MNTSGGVLWQDMTTTEIDAIADWTEVVGLLPVSAVEQHGPHLPLATDYYINDGILRHALTLLPPALRVLILPSCPVGDSLEHTAFPGTLTLRPETVMALWGDIAAAAARAGLRKLVIFNSHGGQTQLVDLVAQRLRHSHGMLVARANYFAFGLPAGLFSPTEEAHGLHGGAIETSIMLHLRPDLVRQDALQDFVSTGNGFSSDYRQLGVEAPVGFAWAAQDLNVAGACGNAADADREKGRAVVEHVGRGLAELLEDMRRCPLEVLRDGPLP